MTKSIDFDLLQDVLQWDVRNWAVPLRYWENSVEWRRIDNCLELGASKGGLSLWLALKGKRVTCSDYGNPSADADMRALHQKYGVAHLIDYSEVDARDIPYRDHYDLIVFKSIIGDEKINNGSDRRQLVFDEVWKALRPGGKLLFAENAVGSLLHEACRRAFVPWGRRWRYVHLDQAAEFLQKFSRSEVRTTGFLGAFGRSESQRSALGVLDQGVLNHLVPSRWHYLVYGIAEK